MINIQNRIANNYYYTVTKLITGIGHKICDYLNTQKIASTNDIIQAISESNPQVIKNAIQILVYRGVIIPIDKGDNGVYLYKLKDQ